VTFRHEKLKVEQRIPAAQRYIAEHRLNELIRPATGRTTMLGIVVQGGLYNSLIRALQQPGLADAFGASRIPLLVLNVTYPLVPRTGGDFCAGKRRCWCWKRATRNTSRRTSLHPLRRRDMQTPLHGKDLLPTPASTRSRCWCRPAGLPGAPPSAARIDTAAAQPGWPPTRAPRRRAAASGPLPPRPPGFCIGCPERPVFSALKLAQQEVGPVHIAADIGCHAFGHLRALQLGPFDPGLRHEPGQPRRRRPMMQRRTLAIMGDGGFWHNGLLTGVQAALFNGDDAVLLIMKNGYTSATGTQDIISTPDDEAKAEAERNAKPAPEPGAQEPDHRATLKGLGVQWMRVVHTYEVARCAHRCRRR
jgi:indolepyruvate ferredoxin oxidoreductase alpha subunit